MMVEPEESGQSKEISREMQMMLNLEHVDHTIFGLFLKFIYTGAYPQITDLRPSTTKAAVQSPYTTPPGPVLPTLPPTIPDPIPPSIHGKSTSSTQHTY